MRLMYGAPPPSIGNDIAKRLRAISGAESPSLAKTMNELRERAKWLKAQLGMVPAWTQELEILEKMIAAGAPEAPAKKKRKASPKRSES